MGERGIGARPVRKIKQGWVQLEDGSYARKKAPLQIAEVLPWLDKNRSRSERVIAFCESFRITCGPDVGKLFVLRDWQRVIDAALDAHPAAEGNRSAVAALVGSTSSRVPRWPTWSASVGPFRTTLCECHLRYAGFITDSGRMAASQRTTQRAKERHGRGVARVAPVSAPECTRHRIHACRCSTSSIM